MASFVVELRASNEYTEYFAENATRSLTLAVSDLLEVMHNDTSALQAFGANDVVASSFSTRPRWTACTVITDLQVSTVSSHALCSLCDPSSLDFRLETTH